MMTGSLLVALLLAQGPAARTFAVDAAHSSVKFHVDHALHKVDGRAPVIEAKALLGADGELRAMARVQVARLETADGNRDANMRAVLESDRYPYVVLKGTSRLVVPATAGEVPLKLVAELDLHGVKRALEIPLQVSFQQDGSARVRGTFAISLDAHRIERPSLLFKKVDDACRVELDLVLRPEAT